MQPLEKMKKLSRGCSWTLAVVAAGSLLIWLLDHVVPSSAVRNLPKGASDINEFYRDSGMSGDFIRLLKARIPREQVAEYARKVGATHKVEPGKPWTHKSWIRFDLDWWKPKQEPQYYSPDGNARIMVGWEDGYVYFSASAT